MDEQQIGQLKLKYHMLIDEYFRAHGWEEEKLKDYRNRLKEFFSDEEVKKLLYEKFLRSGVGESFYMVYGEEIF